MGSVKFYETEAFHKFCFFKIECPEEIYVLSNFSVSKRVILSKEMFLHSYLCIDRFVSANLITFWY